MPTPSKHFLVVKCEELVGETKKRSQFYDEDGKLPVQWRKDNVLRGKLLAKAVASAAKGSKQASSLGEAGQWLAKFDKSCELNTANAALIVKEFGKLNAKLSTFLGPSGTGGKLPSLPKPENLKEAQALVNACLEAFKTSEASRVRLRRAAVACFDKIMECPGAKAVDWGKLGKLV